MCYCNLLTLSTENPGNTPSIASAIDSKLFVWAHPQFVLGTNAVQVHMQKVVLFIIAVLQPVVLCVSQAQLMT